MTFEYKTTTLYKQETGVQFCEFRSMKDDSNDLIIDHVSHHSELASIIETYALLLPYKKDNHEFLKQYTLVYWDWDVLVYATQLVVKQKEYHFTKRHRSVGNISNK